MSTLIELSINVDESLVSCTLHTDLACQFCKEELDRIVEDLVRYSSLCIPLSDSSCDSRLERRHQSVARS